MLERVGLGHGRPRRFHFIGLGLHFRYLTMAAMWRMDLIKMKLEGTQGESHCKTPGKSSSEPFDDNDDRNREKGIGSRNI